jgi:LacI family repressor for deo operon, udp, cdd, tsx, nupC, and nupG
VRNRQADGMILMTGWLPAALLQAMPPTTVIALELIEGSRLPAVAIDNRHAARLAVEHLIALGHRRIAYVGGPPRLVMSADRRQGYLDALKGAGTAADPELICPGNFHFASGQDAVRRLQEKGTAFTAIFCSNDEMAVGALNALRERSVGVPGEVSVVGFDDMDYAFSSVPPLTSVRQPRREIGRRAMQMMVDLLSGKELVKRFHKAGAELVVRASTAPPRQIED